MAKKKQILELPEATIVEVIRVHKRNGTTLKKEMTFGEWKRYIRHKNYWYTAYQQNYSQFNIKKEN